MEPVTHILTGACMGRAGANRRVAYATGAMAVAAQFPDIDTLSRLWGPVTGFAHHRGITHTFLALPVEAVVVTALFYGLHRWRLSRVKAGDTKPLTAAPVRWGALYGFVLLALASHLLLDFMNNYGVRPLFPFHPEWHASSLLFIFDPLIFVLLLLPWVMPPLFALIGSEVGSRKVVFRGRGWAVASLVLISALVGLRAVEHLRAEQLGMQQSVSSVVVGDTNVTPSHLQPQRVLANPDPFDPFRWHLVTDFGDFYQMAEVDLRNGSVTPAQDIHAKPERTVAVLAAMASPIGRVYMDWSPMPWITESKPGDPTRAATDDPDTAAHTLVTFRDPRFMLDLPLFRNRAAPPLTAVVELDAQNRVVRQTMDGSVQR